MVRKFVLQRKPAKLLLRVHNFLYLFMIVADKLTTTFDTLKERFGYTTRMAAPKLVKIVLNVGTGKRSRTDKDWNKLVADRLTNITGQKPASRSAKQSIATFKIRAGDIVGQTVTLRGKRMQAFLEKLLQIAFPRTKDFPGVKRSAVDTMGNLSLGLKEHTIFPEVADEELRNVFGLSVALVSTARTREEATAFFEHLGIPFAEAVETKKKRR